MIQAVFFDMDNTLVQTEWAAGLAVRAVVESFGKFFEQEDEDAVIGLPWETIFDNTLEKYRLPLDRDELREQILGQKELILGQELRPITGAADAVRLCSTLYPVGIVTGSYRKEVEPTLRGLGILDLVKLIVANDDIKVGKPNPLPYLHAAKQLAVSPQNCLVFEDSKMGIAAARAAGMYTVAISEANDLGLDQGGANEIIENFKNVDENWLNLVADKMEKETHDKELQG